VDINIYLPDELGERAKQDPDVNLSRVLRDALIEHYERSEAMSKALSNVETHEVNLSADGGEEYTGRITGARIDNEGSIPIEIYLTDDQRVIVYDGDPGRHWVLEDAGAELGAMYEDGSISGGDYAAAMQAIGERPVIDL